MENKLNDIYNLQVSPRLKDDLATAARWGKIAAIIGFVSSLIGLLANFAKGSIVSGLIGAGLAALMYTYLFQFGSKTQAALYSNDQGTFLEGLKNLQIYFKIAGILVIVVLAIAVLVLLIAIAFGESFRRGFRS